MIDPVPPSAALGVSVAICTYNGVARLPATLTHLQAQIVPQEIPWEAIVIDNASTDDTAKVARGCWPDDSATQLRIVHEPKLGLSNARERALEEARYEVVSFVDDDNWVAANWVGTVSRAMAERPRAGACAGIVDPVFERPAPPWCGGYKWPAVRSNGPREVASALGWLSGAGLNIRASAYQELRKAGFRHFATGRKGIALTVGEDVELCFALRLAGWEIWFEPALSLKHFIPARRLSWDYACASTRGFGFSDVALDSYRPLLQRANDRPLELNRSWSWQMARAVRCIAQNLILRPRKVIGRWSPRYEGDSDVLRIHLYFGRLYGLLNSRRDYAANHQAVKLLARRLSRNAPP